MFGDRPNVVLVMVDDLAYGDLGVTGQLQRAADGLPAIETPNLDMLAMQGLTLENFYATPICASSRAAIMTGFHNGHSSVDRNGGNNGGNAIRDVDVTIGEHLRAAGYVTGQFGKWGLGGYDHTTLGSNAGDINTAAITHPAATPVSQGFDEFYGYLNQLHAHSYYVDFLWKHGDGSDGIDGMQVDPASDADYSHDLIAAKSLDFISDHADPNGANPFFLYAPYTIPHGNYNPPDDAIRQAYVTSGYNGAQADYAAMIKRLDNTIGNVIDRLQDPNGDGDSSDSVYDNTLILFSSDNGGNAPKNALFGGGSGLRGAKGSVYEGGIKSPFIAHWNGTIAPGQVNASRIAGIDDLFATLSDVANARRPLGLDGVSFAGLLAGQQAEKRDVFIFEGNGASWAIRIGDWKLVDGAQLYHLPSDPNESSNSATEQPAITNLMRQIALDEGVLSDVGAGAVQTTHFVQYKSWEPEQGSTDWAASSNWAGGTERNTRGTPANHFDTAPANNWIASVGNATAAARTVVVGASAEVLALEVSGESAPITLLVKAGVSLTARNGLRVGEGATVELNGGSLRTMRAVRVSENGAIVGSGSIQSPYNAEGTPFNLTADVVNEGRIEIAASTSTTSTRELVANGGFELGVQADGDPDYRFSELTAWTTDASTDFDAAKPDNALHGVYRGLIASRADGPHNTVQNTGHSIAIGDELTLRFAHRGFAGWDQGVDSIQATLFYLDDQQVRQPLASFSASPSIATWSAELFLLEPINDSQVAGHELWVAFDAASGEGVTGNEFASIDDVSVTTAVEIPPGQSVVSVDGDYLQTPNGVLAVDLFGATGAPGTDFDQLQVQGVATLAGGLEVRLRDGFVPSPGDLFPVVQASLVEGNFDQHSLPPLPGGLRLLVRYEPTVVTLFVGGLAGDYNFDGSVDAADYTVWRDSLGQTGRSLAADGDGDGVVGAGDYDVWRLNFGQQTVETLARNAPTPEPPASLLTAVPVGIMLITRRASVAPR